MRSIPTIVPGRVHIERNIDSALYGSSLSILVEESMQDDVGSRTSPTVSLSPSLYSSLFFQRLLHTHIVKHAYSLDVPRYLLLLRAQDPCSCLIEKASVCPCKVEKKETLERNDRTADSQRPNETRYR